MKKTENLPNEIILFETDEGKFQIALALDSDSIWLNVNEIAELYQTTTPNIYTHIANILKEGELDEISTTKDYLVVQIERERQVHRNIRHYSLDMILAIGYRVRSERGTQFRIWATQHLSEFLHKGFILDDARLKGNNVFGDYFDELLARIRDIRASEKRAYLRVREIFAMAVDYNPKDKDAQVFFAKMQNKMHFAATQKTAAELIAERADASKANMGLTCWKDQVVRKGDILTAKNFLDEYEIDILNRIVVMWLDTAELRVLRRQQIYTREWEMYLDKFISDNDLPLLEGKGKVSHHQAKIIKEEDVKPYPKYKDSGISWLGMLPVSWDIKKVKHITTCLDGKRIPLNSLERSEIPGDFPYWGANGIVDYINDYLFDEDLVLLGEDGAPFFEDYKPVAFSVSGKIWVNNHIHVLKPKGINSSYLTYCLNITDYSYFISGSTRDKLTQNDMSEIHLPFPTTEEQQAIATYLDDATSRIDALIHKQEQMIELLKEKRIALITHVVTKGLDPNVKMKDSGIEWLGEVPEHWDVAKVSTGYSIQLGKMLQPEQNLESEVMIPYLKAFNVQWDEITVNDDNFMWGSPEELNKYGIKKGDLLVCEGGEAGRSAILLEDIENYIIQNALHRVRSTTNCVIFLKYLLQIASKKGWFDIICNKATIAHFTKDKFAEMMIPFPPQEEQQRIITSIEQKTVFIDSFIQKQEQMIELLHEYRSSLIHHAVTGKIDLRGYHAKTH